MSNSLWPCGLLHARFPYPSPSLRACSNSCPLSWWCHPTISSSVAPFSFCPPSFPASGSFPMSQIFAAGGQNNGTSTSASIPPTNIQGWFSLGLIGLISLESRGSQESSPAPQFKSISSLVLSLPVSNMLNAYFIDESQKLETFGLWGHVQRKHLMKVWDTLVSKFR